LVERLERLARKRKREESLQDIFLQNVDYIRGDATGPHPDSHKHGGVFGPWGAVGGDGQDIDPRDVPDLSEP